MGNLDMALLYNPAASADFEQTLIVEEALVLISVSQSGIGLEETITLQATSKLPLILPSRPNAFRQLIDIELTRLGVKPKIVMEVDGLGAILSLVAEGLGHAVLPSYTLTHYPEGSFIVRAIIQPKLTSQLMLVRPSTRPTTEASRDK